MDPAFISIWLMFLILFIILPDTERKRQVLIRHLKRISTKGEHRGMSEFILNYIGKNCIINSGSLSTSVTGVIEGVNNNWLSVKTKNGVELVNLDFVSIIKERPQKKSK